MTELQKIEHNMLAETIDICEKLNVKYYLVCGSALGAAKYCGFIPWDDDIDIGMIRSDYEVFVSKAPKYFKKRYFLQTFRSDPNYPYIFSKIRDINTTFVETSLSVIDINHGAYIDVFPIDGYPSCSKKQQWLERKKFIYKFQCMSAIKTNDEMKWATRVALKLERICGCHKRTANTLNKLTALLSSYKTEDSLLWCNHGNWQGKLEYALREQYGEGTLATFEGLEVRIPEKYDEYLTQKYGDWRTDLPEDQKVGHHYAEVIDLTRPYTDYIVKLKNGRIRMKTSEELISSGITPPEGYKY